jgi:hypothetical protein
MKKSDVKGPPDVAQPAEIETAKELQFSDMSEAALDGRLGEICNQHFGDLPRGGSWVAITTAAGVYVPESAQNYVRTNLYGALVAPVHGGKSQVIGRATTVLNVKDPFLVETYSGSAEGLIKKIGATGQARLVWVDELSHLMAKANIDRASFPYILNHAYYKDEFSMIISQQKELKFNARLSILGGIVTENFEQSFGHTTAFGLYDRFLFALWPTGFEYDFTPFNGEIANDNPCAVTIDREVWQVKKDWATGNPELTGRIFENALRVAVVCAAWDGRTVLRAQELGPARAFAEYQLRVRTRLKPNPGENLDAKCAWAVVSYLKNCEKFVKRSAVYKAINAVRYGPGAFDRAITNLDFNGQLEQAGKSPRLLRFRQDDEP